MPPPTKKCDLLCHQGKCEMTSKGPKCVCNEFYEGEFCQKFKCSQYCKNGGKKNDLLNFKFIKKIIIKTKDKYVS